MKYLLLFLVASFHYSDALGNKDPGSQSYLCGESCTTSTDCADPNDPTTNYACTSCGPNGTCVHGSNWDNSGCGTACTGDTECSMNPFCSVCASGFCATPSPQEESTSQNYKCGASCTMDSECADPSDPSVNYACTKCSSDGTCVLGSNFDNTGCGTPCTDDSTCSTNPFCNTCGAGGSCVRP